MIPPRPGLVELGGDVVVFLDSITRLGRAYNIAAPSSSRILVELRVGASGFLLKRTRPEEIIQALRTVVIDVVVVLERRDDEDPGRVGNRAEDAPRRLRRLSETTARARGTAGR